MLTMDNTEGFSQEELDVMNIEVNHLMMNYESGYGNREEYEAWAEGSVLKKHGGA